MLCMFQSEPFLIYYYFFFLLSLVSDFLKCRLEKFKLFFTEKRHSPIEVKYRNRSSPVVNGSLYISSPELYQRHRLSTIQDEDSRCDETPVVNKNEKPEVPEKRINKSYRLRKKKKSNESLNVSSQESCSNLTTESENQENGVRKIHRRRKHYSKSRNCQESDKSSDEEDFLKRPRSFVENVENKNNKNLDDLRNKEIPQVSISKSMRKRNKNNNNIFWCALFFLSFN